MATLPAALILAHQGGWDEILFVLAPLVVFGGLLLLARRRAEELEHDETGSPTAPEAADDPDGTDPT